MRNLALTIKQPFASQILDGSKPIEYRSWQTHHRGDIVICASKSPKINGLPAGRLICLAELYDINMDPHTGIFNWHLRNIRPLKQRPVKGQCRLFYVSIHGGDVLKKQPPCLSPHIKSFDTPACPIKKKMEIPDQRMYLAESVELLRTTVKGLFSAKHKRGKGSRAT